MTFQMTQETEEVKSIESIEKIYIKEISKSKQLQEADKAKAYALLMKMTEKYRESPVSEVISVSSRKLIG